MGVTSASVAPIHRRPLRDRWSSSRIRPSRSAAAFTSWLGKMSSVNSSYRTSTGNKTSNLRRSCSAISMRPRTVVSASCWGRYPCSSPRANARCAAEVTARARASTRVGADSKSNLSTRDLKAPIAKEARKMTREMSSLGWIATERSPSSTAPMTASGCNK